MSNLESSWIYPDDVQLNDPEGYIPPYRLMTPTEKEIWLNRYFQLTNKNSFYAKRCFGILYGNFNMDF